MREIIYIDTSFGYIFNGNELGKIYGVPELSSRFSGFTDAIQKLRFAEPGPGCTGLICRATSGMEAKTGTVFVKVRASV